MVVQFDMLVKELETCTYFQQHKFLIEHCDP